VRYIKFPRGVRGQINVRCDGQFSRITAWNLWRPDYLSATITKYRISLLCSRGVPPHILFADTRCRHAVKLNFFRTLPLLEGLLVCTEFEAWRDNPERTDWKKESSLAQLWEPKDFRLDRRPVTIYTEFRRFQTNFPYIFGLYSNAEIEGKETDVWYLSQ
jgi:hypothetical protein